MTKIVPLFSAIGITLGVMLHAGAAEAQNPRTWVSGGGSDSNACSRTAPCATFNHAYGATLAGGEIDVLDGGDFGALHISQAITIADDGAGTGAVTPSVISFLITAGPSDAVVLRGLSILGGVLSSGAQSSVINFASGASLLIDHCKIQGYQQGAAIGSSGAAKLWVKDTVLSNNGANSSASVLIEAPSSGGTTAQFERVQILGATGNGIRVDGSTGAGAVDVELHDVTVDGAKGGSAIVAVSQTSGGPTISIMADNVTASHNAGFGFRAVGGTASVTLSRSVIENNSVGVGVSSGGQVFSYEDNRFANNASDGVTPTPIGLK